MKVTFEATTITEVTFYGMEVDVPEEVVKQGKFAVVCWANQNIEDINRAVTKVTESGSVHKVTGITGLTAL